MLVDLKDDLEDVSSRNIGSKHFCEGDIVQARINEEDYLGKISRDRKHRAWLASLNIFLTSFAT